MLERRGGGGDMEVDDKMDHYNGELPAVAKDSHGHKISSLGE